MTIFTIIFVSIFIYALLYFLLLFHEKRLEKAFDEIDRKYAEKEEKEIS